MRVGVKLWSLSFGLSHIYVVGIGTHEQLNILPLNLRQRQEMCYNNSKIVNTNNIQVRYRYTYNLTSRSINKIKY